ncbi:MAG: hypothetical protein RI911_357 [Candidatus Parcubacteria bacterium]|jgi:predicted metal-dependent hydrolase
MEYIIYKESPRTRSIRIVVDGTGTVRVTYPRRFSQKRVEQWVYERREWIARAQAKMSRGGIQLPQGSEGRKLYSQNKEQARSFVASALSQYKKQFSWKRIRITNTKTRWGSCSTRGTLSFNWRIILLRPELQQYLIVHELCHTLHHNHSPAFWSAVAQLRPEYKKERAALKQYRF